MTKSLKQKAASGMVWTAIQKYSKMGIQFVSGIILARLLTPFDYGCIGMLAIFMVVAETLIDGGFGSALVQKKRPTQEDYSTIFYWNMGLAMVMYVVLFFSAPAIARFYKIPILCDVLRVQGLILFIYSLNLIQRNQLRKQLRFKILAIVRIVTSIISLIITIVMAYEGFGVWALVAQNLISGIIPSLVFWFYVKWHPQLIFSWKSFKELFDFGIFMFLTNLLNNISTQLQGLFIGRFYNPATLGYYSKASGTEKLASGTITGVMTTVTYPLYAEVQDDLPRMQNMLKRLTSTISFITFPLLAILMLVAKPVFVLLYSDRWLDSVPYFQVLCFAGLGGCLTSVNTQCIAAIGKSKTMFLWTIIKRIVGITCIIGGLYFWGMYGLLVGVIINYWFSYFVNIWLVSKYIGYKWITQCLDLLPIALATIVAGGVSYFCGSMTGLDMYLDGLVKLVIFIILYVGWFLLVKPESYLYTKNIVSPVVTKFRNKYRF